MKRLRPLILILAGLVALPAAAQEPPPAETLEALREQTRQARERERALHRQREAEFLEEKQKQQQRLREAEARLEQAEARSNALSEVFDANEQTLTELESELEAESGEVGELFGVFRQVAGDVGGVLKDSMIGGQYRERGAFLDEAADSEALPSIDTLEQLRYEILREMTASGQVARFDAPVVAADGEVASGEVLRVGPFTALGAQGFLGYLPESNRYFVLSRQPGGDARSIGRKLFAAEGGGVQRAVIDPTRGSLLATLVQRPTLGEYIDAGGLVGRIIIGLALIGLGIAAWRAVALLRLSTAVRRQRAALDQPRADNPLGRVLAAYRGDTDTETIELQLDDAVLREVPAIERGLGSIKVLAAVGPLLGLLGTVTGMILTFQQITLFGTGDPKLMADGISQALVTTVLGLIMAIPLVLLHSALRARADALIQVLEEQSAGMVAELAEQRRAS